MTGPPACLICLLHSAACPTVQSNVEAVLRAARSCLPGAMVLTHVGGCIHYAANTIGKVERLFRVFILLKTNATRHTGERSNAVICFTHMDGDRVDSMIEREAEAEENDPRPALAAALLL